MASYFLYLLLGALPVGSYSIKTLSATASNTISSNSPK